MPEAHGPCMLCRAASLLYLAWFHGFLPHIREQYVDHLHLPVLFLQAEEEATVSIHLPDVLKLGFDQCTLYFAVQLVG